MEFKKKIGLAILFLIFIVFLFNTGSYAGTQHWNAIDYDVTLNSDGSMRVVETWNVDISNTNTLFKTFDLSGPDNYIIKDVGVIDVTNNQEKELRQINQYQYHVDDGCFYALDIDENNFEIAWHVGLDDSSGIRTYKMYYTVENAVKIYDDCTELYWQFLSEKNGMYGENLTGRVRLPVEVKNPESFRVWGHGNINAYIFKDSNSEASFKLDKIWAREVFEIRIVTDENIYSECDNRYPMPYLDEILADEQSRADIANKEREEARKDEKMLKILMIGVVVINIVLFLPFLLVINNYRLIGRDLKAKYGYPKSDLEYFRDIPDEKNATPTTALYLYSFSKNDAYLNISKIFSATILNLALKGVIVLEATASKEIKIMRSNKNSDIKLSEDEELILGLIKDAMMGKDYITPGEFEYYAKIEYETVYAKLNSLNSIAKRMQEDLGNLEKERVHLAKKWKSKSVKYIVIGAISVVGFYIGFITPLIGSIIAYMMCLNNSKSISILSLKGNEEKNQWKGLKKYIEDYSMLYDKEVPDIVMWEKYLVYATVFGISKKVLKQLKSIHPEFFENSEYIQETTYWNIMSDSNFEIDVFERFSDGIESVYEMASSTYNAAHSYDSDSSGGGGGFSSSSGGGRRRRWWKLRRSLKF